MKRQTIACFLTTIFMNACASAPTPSNEILNETPFVFETKNGDQVEAFRGQFQAPENRSDPSSRMIDIHYVRFPATSDSKGAPIVYLAGGPGGSGIEAAKYDRFPLFMAMRAFGDVIALDQRGTGASNDAPECKSSVIIPEQEPITDVAYVDFHKIALKECLSFWNEVGIDVQGYTTLESARDLETLRTHLGAQKLTLWGISYGSHLAMAAVKELEGNVEKVVIASAEGLDQTVKLPARTDAYFDRLQAAINEQPEARAVYPDIKAMMKRVHDKLDQDPILLSIPTSDGTAEILFQRNFMQQLASALIADPQRAGMLLGLYLAIDNEQYDPIIGILQRFYEPGAPLSFLPMSTAMDLASGVSATRATLVNQQAETALLAAYLNFPMPQLNGAVPGLDLGAGFRKDPESTVPTLLLSGTLDGRTYPEGHREAMAGFANLQTVTVVNAGHNLFMSSPEVTLVIEEFMRDGDVSTTQIIVDPPDFSPFAGRQ